MGYGSETIHLLFNLMYPFNYTPSYNGNMPQVDHIFPQSELRKVKVANPKTTYFNLLKYHEAERNQLANCELLTQDRERFWWKVRQAAGRMARRQGPVVPGPSSYSG